jgi:hypothetical protein
MESSYSKKDLDPKGYSPNDFYWVSVADKLNSLNCPKEIANVKKINCEKSSITEKDALTCYNSQLCKNKQLSEWLKNVQMNHSGADVRYKDIRNTYIVEIRKSINLVIGIILMILFIIFSMTKRSV